MPDYEGALNGLCHDGIAIVNDAGLAADTLPAFRDAVRVHGYQRLGEHVHGCKACFKALALLGLEIFVKGR